MLGQSRRGGSEPTGSQVSRSDGHPNIYIAKRSLDEMIGRKWARVCVYEGMMSLASSSESHSPNRRTNKERNSCSSELKAT